MVTGAFFEPKALCGSTAGSSPADCGASGRAAAFATTTDGGMIGGSEAAGESTLPDGDCANGCANGEEACSGALCKEGRNRAHPPSNPTLIIPARIRRRFTRSSKWFERFSPAEDDTEFYRETAGRKESSWPDVHRSTEGYSNAEALPRLVAGETGSVVRREF